MPNLKVINYLELDLCLVKILQCTKFGLNRIFSSIVTVRSCKLTDGRTSTPNVLKRIPSKETNYFMWSKWIWSKKSKMKYFYILMKFRWSSKTRGWYLPNSWDFSDVLHSFQKKCSSVYLLKSYSCIFHAFHNLRNILQYLAKPLDIYTSLVPKYRCCLKFQSISASPSLHHSSINNVCCLSLLFFFWAILRYA